MQVSCVTAYALRFFVIFTRRAWLSAVELLFCAVCCFCGALLTASGFLEADIEPNVDIKSVAF